LNEPAALKIFRKVFPLTKTDKFEENLLYNQIVTTRCIRKWLCGLLIAFGQIVMMTF